MRGEFALINHLTKQIAGGSGVIQGIGDDCAVLDMDQDTALLATCDAQVEGIHFVFPFSTPELIGRKALAVNLSDIAAMGGTPLYALISLILPEHLSLETLDGIYAGLRAEAERYHTALVGGNVASSGKGEQLIIDITLLGKGEKGKIILRSGARIGDLLCVTGTPGDSAAGLYTLMHPEIVYPNEPRLFVQQRHRSPTPRISVGQLFAQMQPSGVTSMLDISDGVSGDLQHLCEKSGVGAIIEATCIPLSPSCREIARVAGQNALHWALQGGEDYELLFTVQPELFPLIQKTVYDETGIAVTAIGEMISPEQGLLLRQLDGSKVPLQIESWDHLS